MVKTNETPVSAIEKTVLSIERPVKPPLTIVFVAEWAV